MLESLEPRSLGSRNPAKADRTTQYDARRADGWNMDFCAKHLEAERQCQIPKFHITMIAGLQEKSRAKGAANIIAAPFLCYFAYCFLFRAWTRSCSRSRSFWSSMNPRQSTGYCLR